MNTTLDLSNIMVDLNSSVADKFAGAVLVLKTLGVIAVIYVIYLITNGVLGWLRNRALKRIEQKVDELDKKIDSLIGKKKKEKKKK